MRIYNPEGKFNKVFMDDIVAEIHTILDILRWAISQFNAAHIYYGHGTDNSWDEALQLVLPTLFLPLDLPTEMYNTKLTYKERAQVIQQIIRRVHERIPVPYLTNIAWFCGREFYVDERVFIPRSPISELINNDFLNLLPHSPERILDMCTGSGCIAIASAFAYPDAEIDAVDISANVLEVTEYNIQWHGVEQQVIPIRSDLFNDLPLLTYDLIITNPPYVNADDIKNLPKEFYAEPALSLSAGDNGLELVHRILACASKYLNEDGVLICEVGNSMMHLIKFYPQIPFHWLKFANGSEGVFMLTYQQLIDYIDIFKSYCK